MTDRHCHLQYTVIYGIRHTITDCHHHPWYVVVHGYLYSLFVFFFDILVINNIVSIPGPLTRYMPCQSLPPLKKLLPLHQAQFGSLSPLQHLHSSFTAPIIWAYTLIKLYNYPTPLPGCLLLSFFSFQLCRYYSHGSCSAASLVLHHLHAPCCTCSLYHPIIPTIIALSNCALCPSSPCHHCIPYCQHCTPYCQHHI